MSLRMTPIEDVVGEQAWLPEVLTFLRRMPPPGRRVRFTRARLGRHSSYFMDSEYCRWWVWRRATWAVRICLHRPVRFEVLEGATPESAMEAWREFRKEMRLL